MPQQTQPEAAPFASISIKRVFHVKENADPTPRRDHVTAPEHQPFVVGPKDPDERSPTPPRESQSSKQGHHLPRNPKVHSIDALLVAAEMLSQDDETNANIETLHELEVVDPKLALVITPRARSLDTYIAAKGLLLLNASR